MTKLNLLLCSSTDMQSLDSGGTEGEGEALTKEGGAEIETGWNGAGDKHSGGSRIGTETAKVSGTHSF